MKKIILKNSLIFICINLSPIFIEVSLAQENKPIGSIFVSPISAFSVNSDEMFLTLANTSNTLGKFIFKSKCIVNKVEYVDKGCEKFFSFDLSGMLQDNIITLPANTQKKIPIKLLNKPNGKEEFSAFFTPEFTVASDVDRPKNSLGFDFKFVPGILFSWNSASPKLDLQEFKAKNSKEGVRSVNFVFDISKLSNPQVVSVNAKIIDSKTNKLIRFLDLGKEKLIDPRRKKLVLKGEIDKSKENEKGLCYELLLQELTSNTAYKIKSPTCT
ncbi:hypothetical protein [Fluviispira multicolorata]|uniref:Uncharacterized protein n=1 Tax=Fluviispira multicolorata TaxID=2654512 RepID=A0A833JE32_9BACT|nr:hypothetical protein [Fluviispira multicolorata]KAB8032175.1 hypothetical protein GCL57_05890 [Fluviispira multicolorata]